MALLQCCWHVFNLPWMPKGCQHLFVRKNRHWRMICQDWPNNMEDKGWKVFLVPYEVSSRGQILKSTKSSIITTLKKFNIKIKAEQSMFKQLSKIALLSTFSIFHAYQTKEWVSPPLLKPWLILELACSWKWFTTQRLCLAYSFKPLLFIVTYSAK